MSDYIMHSSGTWKNHKWIRREGSPGDYKYYYKSDLSSRGKDPSPSIVEERFKAAEAERQRRGAEIRNDQVNRKIDGMAGRTSVSPIGGRRRQNSKVSGSSQGRSDEERRAKGASIRNEMVNRMIDAMSGKTVTQLVNVNRAKAKAKKEYIKDDMRSREAQAKHTNAVGGERRKTKQQQWYEKNKAIKEDMRYRSIRFNNGKTHKVGSVSSGKR